VLSEHPRPAAGPLRVEPAPHTPLGVEAKHPDESVLEVINLAPGVVASVVVEQARRLRNPPMSLSEVIDVLANQGLVQSSAKLRQLLASMT
jgi:hypothetical protein